VTFKAQLPVDAAERAKACALHSTDTEEGAINRREDGLIRGLSDEVRKQAYYASPRIPSPLARRYYRLFGDGRRLFDLGCGTGEFGRYRPSDDYEVHGVDMDAGAIEVARDYEITCLHDLSQRSLPYPDGFFDGVLAKDVLEHLIQPDTVVREIRRILKPGGTVIASVVIARPRRVWADYTHMRGFTRETARGLFEDNGFVVEAVWKMGGVPLTARFDLLDVVPKILRFQPFDALWTSSWELRATVR